MIRYLQELDEKGACISVGLVGAGAMGRGIALQVHQTPGMSLAWVADQNIEAAKGAAHLAGECAYGEDALSFLREEKVDVFVEATNSIGAAADYCLAAIEAESHVVLMNAEVDLALGPALLKAAKEKGVVVTSDAGDQHGVLATMIDEALLWGFRIVQAGNIKGFLDREATPESIRVEAEKRNLSATQCCAYTDGTKLHIEMAVLANGYGFLPPEGGMTGPRVKTVQEALDAFDFSDYAQTGRVDYILGAEPGGGVYLIVESPEGVPEEQAFLLNYYKLGSGPYYLLYRPYHLCHLETTRAIAKAAIRGEAVLQSWEGRCADVYAYAKKDLSQGDVIRHGIGSAEVYGLIGEVKVADAEGLVPICLLEDEAILKRSVEAGKALSFDDVELADSSLLRLWKTQLS